MFTNLRGSNPGQGVLWSLALVVALWLVAAGVLVRAYALGGNGF